MEAQIAGSGVEVVGSVGRALGNSPYGQTSTTTGPGQSSNGLMQGLGAAATIAGIGGSLFGAGGMFPGTFAK